MRAKQRSPAPPEDFTRHGVPAVARQSDRADSCRKRILIADDDSTVRTSLGAVLESEGYVVDEARNGLEAVARIVENSPDLVLLDVSMPRWDGWTAFAELDRISLLLPVIVVTARPNQYESAVKLGVDAFMEKPLNIPLLLQAVKHLTGEEQINRVRRITQPGFTTKLLGHAELQ